MNNLYYLITESVEYLRGRGIETVDYGLILGSGLGAIEESFEVLLNIPYTEIPHFLESSITSHKGHLVYARAGKHFLLIFSGRIHYYEGYPMWQVAYPVRILSRLRAGGIISTGAAGGLNRAFSEGDVMLLSDHINLMPENPLRGAHDERFGVRFPDMSAPYSAELNRDLKKSLAEAGLHAHEGVYAALAGPSLETRAEYVYLHRIGADCVGMSIVPECIVAAQEGIPFAAVAVISNICYPPEAVTETTIEGVLEVVSVSASRIGQGLKEYIIL